mmetsp:Transcript_431/g.833  ORF Transcript_431/g.833 Transcript_431/m.833 type:complete len:298 (-) Transcript_431:450-1343(-)
MGKHTRHVLGHNGETDGVFRCWSKGGSGEVDRVANGSRLEEVANSFGGHGGSSVFGLVSGGAKVGEDDGVGVVVKGVIREVRDVSSIIVIQMRLKRIRIHQLAPSEVQQNSASLEVANNILSNNTMSSTLSLNVWDINRDVISIPYSIGNTIRKINRTGQLQGILNTKTGIVSHNIHAQMFGITRGRGTNVSQSNHGKSLTLDLPSAEKGLVLLNTLLRQSLLAQRRHVVDTIDNTTASQKHTSNNQLLDSIRIRTRSIKNRNTQLGHPRHRNIIRTSTTSRNSPHRMRNLLLLQLM